ncbi:putative aspartic-type endopeptidase OPSB [Yarrowia sp. C11]|nr:putative aspartic-type endopeptidase OPSB [Yarrowia sp. C11]KAG5371227.1 putative aspartic-type endopeptidase OPSB [Yarrowia sp. E02]
MIPLLLLLLPLVAASVHFDMSVRRPSAWDLGEVWGPQVDLGTYSGPDSEEDFLDEYNMTKTVPLVPPRQLKKRVVTDEQSVTVSDYFVGIELHAPGAGHTLEVPIFISEPYTWFFGSENGENPENLVYDGTGGRNLTDVFGHGMVSTIVDDWMLFADYWTDDLTFGPEIGPKDFVFGRSTPMSPAAHPGLGLGPAHTESIMINGSEYTTSFLGGLMNGGYIERRQFSMYLGGNSTTSKPNIIFGGVDTNMVRGNWSTFPILHEANATSNSHERFFIAMTGLSITRQDNTVDNVGMSGDAAVLIDPQFALSYIPGDAMVNLAVMLGAVFFDGLGGWICDCRLREVGAFINIQLSNTTFSMSVYDVLLPLTDGFGKPVNFTGGGEACAVTFSTSEFTGYNVLGFNFLQNLYTSFDIDSKEVSIAKLRKGALQSPSYKPNIIPLRGPIGEYMNATTVKQPDLEYTYGTPQFNTTKYPTAGGDRMTRVVLSDPTGVVTYEGITVPGGSGSQSRLPLDSEPFTIQVSASSTSSKPGALIQLYGTPISGSHTIFRDAPSTGASTTRPLQIPPSGMGAPRSVGSRLAVSMGAFTLALGLAICM